MWRYVLFSALSRSHILLIFPLLVILTFITWLKWCLSGFSTISTIFPFESNKYFGREILWDYINKYMLLFQLSLKILQLQIIFSSLIGEKLYFHVVLICCSFVMNEVGHLFMFSSFLSNQLFVHVSCPFFCWLGLQVLYNG